MKKTCRGFIKLTPLERDILLDFLDANLRCDLDGVSSGILPSHWKDACEKQIMAVYTGLKRKLKTVPGTPQVFTKGK